jgi:uncharacterized SAM-binding protein YcdF (DUF218 family)
MEVFFYLKKAISIIESPLILVMTFILINIYLLKKNKNPLYKFNIFIFVFLFLFSYGPIANFLSSKLENQYKSLEKIPENIEKIVLLGGDFDYKVYEVINLYNKIENAKIILFGNDSTYNFLYAKDKYNILLNSGIDKKNVTVNFHPKDTKSEIKEIKALLGEENFILVANALHMPRIKILCDKLGVKNVYFSPTNYFSKHKYSFFSLPNAQYLYQSKESIHEYIGILYEKIF